MNNELKAVLVIGLVLVGGFGFFLGRASVPGGFLGSQTVNYTNSGNSANLYASLESIARDAANARAPLSGLKTYSSSSFTIPTMAVVGTVTSTITSSTPGASVFAGVLPGDFVLVGVNATSTGFKNLTATGQVASSDTVIITFTSNPTGTMGWVGGTVPLTVAVLPQASFVAPAALNTVTSTSN